MMFAESKQVAPVLVIVLAFLAAGCDTRSAATSSVQTSLANTTTNAGTAVVQIESATTASDPTTTASSTTSSPALAPSTVIPSTSSSDPTSTTSTTIDRTAVHRFYPIDAKARSSFGNGHHDYPAADIFAACGTQVFAPVDGVIDEVQKDNRYDPKVDDPATRGGIFLSIVGDDSVRYYMAHFTSLQPSLAVGQRIEAGSPVGKVGMTGRAGACHLHFALSQQCGAPSWWIRRGVVWPQQYLRSWKAGGDASPVDEVDKWAADHPDACVSPDESPFPVG